MPVSPSASCIPTAVNIENGNTANSAVTVRSSRSHTNFQVLPVHECSPKCSFPAEVHSTNMTPVKRAPGRCPEREGLLSSINNLRKSASHKLLSGGDHEWGNSGRKRNEGGGSFDFMGKWQGGDSLALYEEESGNFLNPYISGYTTPGPAEREASKHKKANLGVMLGVYLPTIQHILGVTMFIRLAWCVGVAGIGQTFLMLFVCCFCTFLTCISVSAVATNGVVESGGAYFMISRNLGPEFGSAVGILFYLANTVATAMYLVGGVEILLLYIFPGLTIGGTEAHTDTGLFGMMSNNLRFYGTILILIEFVIVAMGVRFVQALAPISLVCVIASILACYAGGIEKTLNPVSGQGICMYGDHLLQAKMVLAEEDPISEMCNMCNFTTNPELYKRIEDAFGFDPKLDLYCKNGYPGYGSDALIQNLGHTYPKKDEYKPGHEASKGSEIFSDVDTTFFLILAIYFPAVTGIFTGTNMSGDLENPQKSIPAGTIAAQLTTSFIYFSLALVFGAAISPELLRDKYGLSLHGGMVVAGLAWPSEWVLLIGSFLSTFGAALQCLCSAPRLLQSIAKDDVIPILRPFAIVTKKNEPFYGLIITTIIAEMGILLGAMDSIAEVVDFFFLMCYAFVNIICFMHSVMGAPNWRPRFKYYHWSLSLLGTILCFFIMFSTHWDYAIVSLALCLLIYKYVEWKGAKKEWGDGIRGLALSTAQYSLMKIPERDPHPKNWRPQLLILHSMPWSKELVDIRYLNLINFAAQLKAGKGLTMVVSFIRGDPGLEEDLKTAHQVKSRMENDMQQSRLRGFAKTLLYNEDQITGSLNALIQSIGIGGLRPNTLLLSWPTQMDAQESDSEYQTFTSKLLAGALNGMALVVAKGITEFPSKVKLHGYLDVYWIVRDGGLCVLITFLLRQSRVWRHCKIRIVAVAGHHENNAKIKAQLKNYIYQLRIDAEVIVTELSDPELSKTAFERTLLMEERTKMLRHINQKRSNDLSISSAGYKTPNTRPMSPLASPDNNVKSPTSDNKSESLADSNSVNEAESKSVDKSLDNDVESSEEKSLSRGDTASVATSPNEHPSETHRVAFNSSEGGINDDTEKAKRLKALDRKKVHKMHGAIRLNEVILEHSSESQLVLFSLPRPPTTKEMVDDYMHYLEVISDKLKRVLFVRGTGGEVITTDS
ncbi:amino acid permease domain-containing protein [Ditylenchus destructor]|uniref:Amino acid permease domain-containing protein n=1 Tax=Ditylenchus destructor TaxID=166010 RepID=A0AAD4MVI6_9BILA|nr:amino acid permease domain-containing protein [Ditylenchus destructor]